MAPDDAASCVVFPSAPTLSLAIRPPSHAPQLERCRPSNAGKREVCGAAWTATSRADDDWKKTDVANH